jgi:hypothetical protein
MIVAIGKLLILAFRGFKVRTLRDYEQIEVCARPETKRRAIHRQMVNLFISD